MLRNRQTLLRGIRSLHRSSLWVAATAGSQPPHLPISSRRGGKSFRCAIKRRALHSGWSVSREALVRWVNPPAAHATLHGTATSIQMFGPGVGVGAEQVARVQGARAMVLAYPTDKQRILRGSGMCRYGC